MTVMKENVYTHRVPQKQEASHTTAGHMGKHQGWSGVRGNETKM